MESVTWLILLRKLDFCDTFLVLTTLLYSEENEKINTAAPSVNRQPQRFS